MEIPKLSKNCKNEPREDSREPLGTGSLKHPVSERSLEGPMCFPYNKYHASGTCREVSLGALSAPFWLPFLLLLSPLSLQSHQKNNSGKQEKNKKNKNTEK